MCLSGGTFQCSGLFSVHKCINVYGIRRQNLAVSTVRTAARLHGISSDDGRLCEFTGFIIRQETILKIYMANHCFIAVYRWTCGHYSWRRLLFGTQIFQRLSMNMVDEDLKLIGFYDLYYLCIEFCVYIYYKAFFVYKYF